MTKTISNTGVVRATRKPVTHSLDIRTISILDIISDVSEFSKSKIVDGLVMSRAKEIINKKEKGHAELRNLLGQNVSTVYK